MKLMRSIGSSARHACSWQAAHDTAAGQTAVTSADIQRLQDTIYDVSRDLGQTRTRDRALASQLEGELDDARDEAIYLKVKLRKNEPIARRRVLRAPRPGRRHPLRARGDAAARSTEPASTGRSA